MRAEDWIIVMLAGVTLLVTLLGVMLAILAIVLGIAALWGYEGLMEAAGKAATAAAKEVSLESVTQRAMEIAKETAQTVVWENKDRWLTESALGLELAVAQSESSEKASNGAEQVGDVYPGDPGGKAENVDGNNEQDAGADHSAAPDNGPR